MPSDEHSTAEEQEKAAAPIRRMRNVPEGLRWQDTPLKEYKPEGKHFEDITRQVLFGVDEGLSSELRYFEIGGGGHSTLEKHEHVHAVLILHGQGRVLVGEAIHAVVPFDLVHVPSWTWHQFRADPDTPLGFLCLVDCDRDRPHRPTEEEAKALRRHATIGGFVRL